MTSREEPMPSLGSLRSSSCILLTQLQAHIGTSCGPRSKDPHWMMGKQVHFLDKAIMSNPSSTTVSIFFLACQVCTMRTWLCGMAFFLAQKLFSNTSNQNFHPQQNISRERCFRGAYLCSKSQQQAAASKDSVLSGE